MSVSQVEICNRAIAKIGGTAITSLNDNSKAARKLTDVYASALRAELTKVTWNFAKDRASLAALSEAPEWGYDTQFQLPSDCLRVIQINDIFIAPSLHDYVSSDNSAWSIEGGKVLTNFAAPLKIRYIKDVTDEAQFAPLFVEVFACKLASEICYPILNSTTRKAEIKEEYKEAMIEAARANAIELPPAGMADDSWILGRL